MGTVWVCDTNVLYDCATDLLSPAMFVREGDTMAITPVSILEIASKLSPKTFAERKAAAAKALELNVTILPDPEVHLASIWGLPIEEGTAKSIGRSDKPISVEAAQQARLLPTAHRTAAEACVGRAGHG